MALRDPSPVGLRPPPSRARRALVARGDANRPRRQFAALDPTGGEGFCAIIIGAAAIFAAGAAFGQGDAQRGQQVFQDQCSGCHVLTGEGYAAPPLAGVYGRKAGAVAGFGYSDAMTKSGIVWNDASLGGFLADPSKSVPGTAMAFNVTDAQQRDDVIAYLKAQSPGAH